MGVAEESGGGVGGEGRGWVERRGVGEGWVVEVESDRFRDNPRMMEEHKSLKEIFYGFKEIKTNMIYEYERPRNVTQTSQ